MNPSIRLAVVSLITTFNLAPVVVVVTAESAGGPEFSYKHQLSWPGTCTSGSGQQSPIDIDPAPSHWTEDDTLTLQLIRFDHPFKGKLENNGHTIKFTLEDKKGQTPRVYFTKKDRSKETYYHLTQIHFHWNRIDSTRGSEHKIMGESHSVEQHMVFKNNVEEDSNSLLVLATMYDIAGVESHNGELESLITVLKKVGKLHSELYGVELNPADLLPEDLTFVHYQGSLTTPPCSEVVTWIVFTTPRLMSLTQWFTGFRPIQIEVDESSCSPPRGNTRSTQKVRSGTTFYRGYADYFEYQ